MYNPLLDTFIAVCDCGRLYQGGGTSVYFSHRRYETNESLEEHLDLKLIERSPSGIRPDSGRNRYLP